MRLATVLCFCFTLTDTIAVPHVWHVPSASTHVYSVVKIDGQFFLKAGRAADAIAWGSFENRINETGWSVLDVHSTVNNAGSDQAYAAGYLEGALMAPMIHMHFQNVWQLNFNASVPFPAVPAPEHDFVQGNLAWMRQGEVTASPSDKYWQHVGFLLDQLDGLTAGYNAKTNSNLSSTQMMILSLIDGDLGDIQSAIAHAGKSSVSRFWGTHCSAMVARLPADGGAEVAVAHTNWDSYQSMLRVIKHFDLALPGSAATRIVMDSYPGVLYSETDFYRTSAGLTITETSIDNLNPALWVHTTPHTMLTWARAMVANRLASTAEEWTTIQAKHNSGTCNNQWIVVDGKLIKPHEPLPAGTVWIAETLPGVSEASDITAVLNGPDQSWFSFNVPYFKAVLAQGGYDKVSDPEFTWHASRELMYQQMRREAPVGTLEDVVRFMRYNNASDPLARRDRCNGISARCDLNPPSSPRHALFGAQDVKVVAVRRNMSLGFQATLSPTFDEHNPPFAWTTQPLGTQKPRGHPDVFNFSMQAFQFRSL